MTALKKLQPLEKKIDSLKAKKAEAFNMHEMIQFNPEEIYFILMKSISIKGAINSGAEKYLIGERKYVDLRSGMGYELKKAKKVPREAGVFQINQKIYIAGGERNIEEEKIVLSSFFSLDYKGVSTIL